MPFWNDHHVCAVVGIAKAGALTGTATAEQTMSHHPSQSIKPGLGFVPSLECNQPDTYRFDIISVDHFWQTDTYIKLHLPVYVLMTPDFVVCHLR